jgi:hypothetical protein
MVVKKGPVVIWPNKIPSTLNVYISLFHAFSMGFNGKRQLLLTQQFEPARDMKRKKKTLFVT